MFEIEKYKNMFIEKWYSLDKMFQYEGQTYSLIEKFIRQRYTNKFINEVNKILSQCPKNEESRGRWRDDLWSVISEFAEKFGYSREEIDSEFSKSLPKVTYVFLEEVNKFNPNLGTEEIFQALRNVWIMNILQYVMGIKVKYSPSIFAYSMLYPYTDNVLDSDISKLEKKEINEKFRRRLNGEIIRPKNKYEQELYSLIEKIEVEYIRKKYNNLYSSLIAIHDAQQKSLKQQRKNKSLNKEEIVSISVEKGGCSVLADAYLVKGELEDIYAQFSFGYGVMLQFCDDLQDIDVDVNKGHMTIFTDEIKKGNIDNTTCRLINFSLDILNYYDEFLHSNYNTMREFLIRNVMFLIMEAVSQNQKYFSKEFLKNIRPFYPYTINYTKRLYKKIKRNYDNFKSESGYSFQQIIKYSTE